MADYKAFISYSREEDRKLGPRLQREVERYASKWYQLRAFRIFLDTRSLTKGPRLWPSIYRAMERSEWLVLLASRAAAESEGVDKEVEWWLGQEDKAGKLLIVDTEGRLEWNDTPGCFADEDALPAALRGVIREAPNLVEVPETSEDIADSSDDEFKLVTIDVAAALREIDKDLLMQREERERKIRTWFVRVTISILSILLVVAVGATVLALQERSKADERANLALSRQVATASEAASGADLDAAMLLAVQGFRVDPNPATRAALFKADTASPDLVRFLHADAAVTALVGSRKGGFVIAGLADGSVVRWGRDGARPRLLMKLSRKVVSLATDEDGSVIAASDRAKGMLWREGQRVAELPVARGTHCDAVGLSPLGRTVVYGAAPAGEVGTGIGTITVAPAGRPADGIRHPDPIDATTIAVQSDRRALLFGPPSIARESFSHWSRHSTTEPGFGAHTYSSAVSADGRFITDTNGATPIPIWRTRGSFTPTTEADAYAEAPLAEQGAMAMSPDGKFIAVVGPGEIYVTPKVESGQDPRLQSLQENPGPTPISLTGEEAEEVAFVDDSHLLSSAGREIAVWDTDQVDRLAETEKVPLEFGCEECGPPQLSVSPNGKRLAIRNGSNSFVEIQALRGGHRSVLPNSEIEFSYGGPIWRGDGGVVAFPIWSAAGSSTPSHPQPSELPSYVRLWSTGNGSDRELTDGRGPGGRTAITVDEEGEVFRQDALTGNVLDSFQTRGGRLDSEPDTSAAISPSGRLLATAREDEVRVVRLPRATVVTHFTTPESPSLTYIAGHLLVESGEGELQVRNETGTTVQSTLAGQKVAGWLAASPTVDLVARSLTDGAISLEELSSGARIASLTTPGGSLFLKTGIAFTPDGKTLVSLTETTSETGVAILVRRNISDSALIQTACAAAGHDLDPTEWRTLVGTTPPPDLHCLAR